MKKLILSLLCMLASCGQAAYAATVSTVNPNVPAANSPLSSSVVRNNFAAAYNDINALWAAVGGGGGGGSTTLTGDVTGSGTGVFSTLVALPIRIITANSYSVSMLAADGTIIINNNTPGATTVYGPATPKVNRIYTIKDGGCNSETYLITFSPASGGIDGNSTYVLSRNCGSIDVVWDGTAWRVV